MNNLTDSVLTLVEQTKANYEILAIITAILWAFYVLSVLTGRRLLILGIIPRKPYGLPGIIFCPFLHADFNHIFFNTIPLLVLSNFILFQGLDVFFKVTIIITLVSGILVWLFAKDGIHVGASGVITGYWGYLIMDAYQQPTITSIILGVVCIYYFAGIFFGIFPGKKGISWEAHLFGLLAGLLTSYLMTYGLPL
jgi:membrane associated rhomboid family serine protease